MDQGAFVISCPHCGKRFSVWKRRPKRERFRSLSKDGQHEYVHGILAKTMRRLQIFRAAGGEADWFDEDDPSTIEEIRPAVCQGCSEQHFIGWNEGHWHHNCSLRKKCDAVKCGLFVCERWHRAFHGRVIAVTQRG